MKDKRLQRRKRIRAKISGTSSRPRLSIFKSNKYIYAQVINDDKGETIFGLSDRNLKEKNPEKSKVLGEMIAKKAKEKKINEVVFDRGGFSYHGKIKAIADAVREGGIKF